MKSFINFLPPWVETNIQPAFYDKESGSVLQQTARMYAKVNQLVRHFNCLAKETKETVDEYIAKFVELKDFVDTYFENLDVQEEINNKLDEMVEDGTMAEILEGTIFPTILEMIGDTTNPIHYGADPTGTEDSTQAINDCIQANKGGVVNFTSGTYKLTDSILLPYENADKVSINGNGATLKLADDVTTVIICGADRAESYVANNVGFTSIIKGLNIDCEGYDVTNAVEIKKGHKDVQLIDCRIYRALNGVLIGETSGTPADVLIENCMIYGKGSEYDGTGVISNCSDNNVISSRIYGFRKGFYIYGYITIAETQVLLRWENQTTENFNPYPVDGETFKTYYALTMFAQCDGPAKFLGCYCDSMCKFLNVNTTESILVDNAFYFNARGHVDIHIFDIYKPNPKFTLVNSQLCLSEHTFNEGVEQTFGRNLSNSNFTNYAQITISGIQTTRIQYLTNPNDFVISGVTVKQTNNVSCSPDTWMLIAIVGNWHDYAACDAKIKIQSWEYDFHILDNGGTLSLAQTLGNANSSTVYTFGVVRDSDKLYLCVKLDIQSNSSRKFNCDIVGNDILFNIPPVYRNSIQTSNRTLTNYTNLTPTKTVEVKEALGIIAGA